MSGFKEHSQVGFDNASYAPSLLALPVYTLRSDATVRVGASPDGQAGCHRSRRRTPHFREHRGTLGSIR